MFTSISAGQHYMLNGDGELMPSMKDQPAADPEAFRSDQEVRPAKQLIRAAISKGRVFVTMRRRVSRYPGISVWTSIACQGELSIRPGAGPRYRCEARLDGCYGCPRLSVNPEHQPS